jgi:glyoxylase-like metal-dependent hydrolase (beta-lactamase superfamily II)
MKLVAENVYQLPGFPPNAINCYLVGDVLVDSATRSHARFILRKLKGHSVNAHALTHAHGDHQGSSAAICAALGIPYWVGAGDVGAAESGRVYEDMPHPLHPMPRLYSHIFPGPGRSVDRVLTEGDAVGDFTVLETPGHSAGHISLWRESDRTLICGDVITTMDVNTMLPGLHEPMPYFTPDPATNRASIRRIAELEPAIVCVGHGKPLRDPAKLKTFAASLPPD